MVKGAKQWETVTVETAFRNAAVVVPGQNNRRSVIEQVLFFFMLLTGLKATLQTVR